MPARLRLGIEGLSGLRMQDVRVHYDSPEPARVEAHAFARGGEVHLAPGQEAHLPHEAWHVVQQRRTRLRPNLRLNGAAIREDASLEREAADMGARALRAHAPDSQAPDLAPPPSGAARAAAAAPIQRVKWKWNHSAKSWETADGSVTTEPPPSHQGSHDGEEWEHAYSQAKDPTMRRFFKSGERYVGQPGAEKRLKGVTPTAGDIRVPSKPAPALTGGSGLHEVLPTNLRDKIAKSGNKEILAGLQSGLRTSTTQQLFNREPTEEENLPKGSKEVGTHTGYTQPGTSRTKGQGPAHDVLRDMVEALETINDPDEALNTAVLKHLDVTPTSEPIRKSAYITGMKPKITSIGEVGASEQDAGRVKPLKEAHRGRELVKTRERSRKRHTGRGRSPSPDRTDIDDQGKGGEYVAGDRTTWRLVRVPRFKGSTVFKQTAYAAAWVTAPQREEFVDDSIPVPSTTPVPSITPLPSTSPVPSTTPVPLTAPLPLGSAAPTTALAPLPTFGTTAAPVTTSPVTLARPNRKRKRKSGHGSTKRKRQK